MAKKSQAKHIDVKKNSETSQKQAKSDVWNLQDVLQGMAVEQIVEELKSKIESFKALKPKLNPNISNDDFKKIIFLKEQIKRLSAMLMHYHNLRFYEDNTSEKNLADLTKYSQLITELGNETIFFSIWLMHLDDKNVKRLVESKGLEKYKHHLEDIRKYKRYTKSEDVEQIMNLKDLTGEEALVTIYDIIHNGFTFEFDGKTMNEEQLRSQVRSPDPKIREKTYNVLLGKYRENSTLLSEIYKDLALSWYNDGIKIRCYKSPISVRNMANDIDDDAVDALLNVARKNSKLFAEYFKLKHDINKKNGDDYRLSRFHLYAPYNSGQKDDYEYEKSKDMVLGMFKDFDPRFFEIAKGIFDKKHVHSHPAKGKRGGAFCECSSINVAPYVLLNYTGILYDVFTMAHELGHAIHYTLSQSQTEFTYDASLPMAETASVFSEMLLAHNIMKSADKKLKIALLMSLLDNQYATIGRQAYFVIFEKIAHDLVAKGATKKELEDAYYTTLTEQMSPMEIPDLFRNEWNLIPHIHETPFYCYAYAWGNLLVLALYNKYKKEGNAFVEKYIKLLSYGESKSPKDMLAELGINPSDEKFWQSGFDLIKEEIEDLKGLTK